jgi:hypothetical protein
MRSTRWRPENLLSLAKDDRMVRKPAMAYPHLRLPRVSQCRTPVVQGGGTAGEHQLEKLEFALAVALTRGDQRRSDDLRRQIDALGGNSEEPGT